MTRIKTVQLKCLDEYERGTFILRISFKAMCAIGLEGRIKHKNSKTSLIR